jgi:hypothetical protein
MMRSSRSRSEQGVVSGCFGEDDKGVKPHVGEPPKSCIKSYVFRFLGHLYHVLHIGVYPTKLDVGILQVIQTASNYIPFGLKSLVRQIAQQ